MNMSMKKIAQLCIDIQEACNLVAVFNTAAKVSSELKSMGIYDNAHPAMQLLSDKIASLTETQTIGNDAVMAAYQWAYKELGK